MRPVLKLLISLMCMTTLVSTLFVSGQAVTIIDLEDPVFRLVTDDVGIDVSHESMNDFTPQQYLGVGQAFGDIDNDGWQDIYMTSQNGSNVLYRNVNGQNFEVSSHSVDVSLPEMSSGGAIFGDIDNDNDQDLYVLNNGENRLFRNDLDEGFTDITDISGTGDVNKGSSGSFADFDKDGLLDLYISNWMCDGCRNGPFTDMEDKLYRNLGDGTFEDVSHLLGYEDLLGAGFIGSWFDYDNDHDLDLYVVNDQYANPIGNKLFRNDGAGCDYWCFTEVSRETDTDIEVYGMGIAIGDFDHDFDMDMYITNMGEHVMLLNEGDGTFDDYTVKTNSLVGMSVGWSSLFFDFDNDLYEDLFVSSGNLDSWLFHNTGYGYFEEATLSSGTLYSQGASYGDYNKDGWIDLLIGQRRGAYHMLENRGYEREYRNNNWITFELDGLESTNFDATGTRIYLKSSNELGHMKETYAGIGLGGGSTTSLHFGLSEFEVSEAIVKWPDGKTQKITEFELNSYNTITYDPTGNLNHDQILEELDVELYHNPNLSAATAKLYPIISSILALLFVIFVPYFAMKQKYDI